MPFHAQSERRSAVYLRCFSKTEWAGEQKRFLAEQQRQKDIAARSVEVLHLGEMQPEHDHALVADRSYPLVYRGRNGRDLRSGGFIQFRLRVDGTVVATPRAGTVTDGIIAETVLPIPAAATANRTDVLVRLEGSGRRTAGPFFDVRILSAGPGIPT